MTCIIHLHSRPIDISDILVFTVYILPFQNSVYYTLVCLVGVMDISTTD